MNKKGYNFMAFTIIVLFFILITIFAGVFVALEKRSLQENMDDQINYHQAETDLLVFLRLPVEVKGNTMTIAELIINLAEEQMTLREGKFTNKGINIDDDKTSNRFLQPLVTKTNDFFQAAYEKPESKMWALQIYFPHKEKNLKHGFQIKQIKKSFTTEYDIVIETIALYTISYGNPVSTNLPLISGQSVEIILYSPKEIKTNDE